MCLKDAIEAAVRRPHLWEATALAIGLSKRYGLAPVEPIEGAEFIVFASGWRNVAALETLFQLPSPENHWFPRERNQLPWVGLDSGSPCGDPAYQGIRMTHTDTQRMFARVGELTAYLEAREAAAQAIVGRAADQVRSFADLPARGDVWREFVPAATLQG